MQSHTGVWRLGSRVTSSTCGAGHVVSIKRVGGVPWLQQEEQLFYLNGSVCCETETTQEAGAALVPSVRRGVLLGSLLQWELSREVICD